MSQPTYYFGFDHTKIGVPSIAVVRGAFTYATLTFAQAKYYLGLNDGAGYASFAAALQTSLNAAAATAGDAATWTVTWSHAALAFTITVSTGSFTATLDTVAKHVLGATGNISGAPSWTSAVRPYYVIRPTNDSWRRDARDYEADDVGAEDETDDGDAYGIGRTAVAVYTDLTQLFEPLASTYADAYTTAVPWTWQHAFKHARHIEPIILARAPWSQASIYYSAGDVEFRGRWRVKGASFKPKPHIATADTFWQIPQAYRVLDRTVQWTVDYTVGTFSRTAAAWYQTGAPTDGSSAFMAQAPGGTRVYDNLGDGAGPMLRVEGARTNQQHTPFDPTAGPWWTSISATDTPISSSAPDGGTVYGCNVLSGGVTYAENAGHATGVAGPVSQSLWLRSETGTGAPNFNFYRAVSGRVATSQTVGTTFARFVLVLTTTAIEVTAMVGIDGRDWSGIGGVVAGARNFRAWGAQTEPGAFPSSLITTTTAPVTRDPDVLTLTTAQLPALLFTAAGQFTQLSPEFANTDLVSGDTYWLWATDASNGVRIKHDGTGVRVEAVAGGVVKAASGYLTFARNALLGAVRWDPVAAVVSVNGTAGATGTAWSWTQAAIRVGGIPSSTGEAFCRFGTLQSA